MEMKCTQTNWRETEIVTSDELLCITWNGPSYASCQIKWCLCTLWQMSSHLLTYSMQKIPSWEVNRFSASQAIPHILRSSQVYYSINKCLPPVPILNQTDPVHVPHPTPSRSTLILSSHLRSGLPGGFFSSLFPTKTLYTPLLSPLHATVQPHFH